MNTSLRHDVASLIGGTNLATSERDTNPSTKPSTKGKTFSKEEEQEKKWYLDNPMANIRDEHRYLFIDNQ